MHEVLSWLHQDTFADSSASDGANNKDVLIAIVGVMGTLLVTGLTAIVATFKRERSPESTVDSVENQTTIRHEAEYQRRLQEMREELDEANYAKDNNALLYQKLREAVWAHGLNPDHLMEQSNGH